MLKTVIVSIVGYCTRYPWQIVAIGLFFATGATVYTFKNFAINTDIGKLISPHLEWRQRELALDRAFPQRYDSILAVINAPTPELVGQASAALVQRLSGQTHLFRTVQDLHGSPFFAKNGLLFMATDEVERIAHQLDEAEPLFQILITDPTLRGLTHTLFFVLMGAQRRMFEFDDMARPLNMFAEPLEKVLGGQPATFSWRELLHGPLAATELRRFILLRPILNFAALQPGQEATDTIRRAAADLDLAARFQARLRLTGPVPIADEEFATVQEGAVVNTTATMAVVLTILWLALRSPRIILAVFLTLFAGLAITAAVGLMMVGALNLISIAFAVLFVGIGVDFGIQFGVRYRAERHENDDLRTALSNAAGRAGAQLTLAAAATAAGFLSFLPTAYRGVSELGQIAGVGMIIAFVTCITILPALLTLLNPAGEREPIGFSALAPVDRFLERHRVPVLVGTGLVALAGLPLLYHLQFDFNPINLRSPKVESIATFLELRGDPSLGANSIDVMAASGAAAREVAERLRNLPQVSRVMTLESFIPDDQDKKLSLIKKAADTLEPDFQEAVHKAPSDADNVAALREAADELTKAAADKDGAGAVAAKRLAAALSALAQADELLRTRAEFVLVSPLKIGLQAVRASLQAEKVTEDSLPPSLVQQWTTADGRMRVEALPKGDANDNETLREFARAVLAVEPAATGGPISILESGRTVVSAFIQAGIWALVSIAILLWMVLRRFGDVLLTLIPLILAGVVTLELCVIIGLPLNFANIIALPLLLGIGVAFKIYYVMAWRAGQTDLLQSSLTHAVVFSAMTTATAFGSLWLSSHPGTSSMGKLLALSLVCTLAAAVLFQPARLGRPRNIQDG